MKCFAITRLRACQHAIEAPEQDAKCSGYFKTSLPRANRFAILVNPDHPVFRGFIAEMARELVLARADEVVDRRRRHSTFPSATVAVAVHARVPH